MNNETKKLTPEQQELVLNNLNLVYDTYHNTYPNPRLWIKAWEEDIIEEGKYGLCKAALRFNPDLGYTFSTYAVPSIRHAMGMLIRKIKNDFMVDSIDEVLGEEDGENGNTRLERLSANISTPEEDYIIQEKKDLILNILKGAPTQTQFIFYQIIFLHKRQTDIWLEFFADKTHQYINNIVRQGQHKLKQIWESQKNITIPKKDDYISELAYKEDIKRLWKTPHPELFKRNSKYLKKSS